MWAVGEGGPNLCSHGTVSPVQDTPLPSFGRPEDSLSYMENRIFPSKMTNPFLASLLLLTPPVGRMWFFSKTVFKHLATA